MNSLDITRCHRKDDVVMTVDLSEDVIERLNSLTEEEAKHYQLALLEQLEKLVADSLSGAVRSYRMVTKRGPGRGRKGRRLIFRKE